MISNIGGSIAWIKCEADKIDIKWLHAIYFGENFGEDFSLAKEQYELDFIHKVAMDDPSYFFDTVNMTWVYSGVAGPMPDFLGFQTSQHVGIGELKWKIGWDKRLANQVERYIQPNIWLNSDSESTVTIYISSPQTASLKLIERLKNIPKGKWKSVRCMMGFIQFGTFGNNTYMRVVWASVQKWDGTGFSGLSEAVGIHG